MIGQFQISVLGPKQVRFLCRWMVAVGLFSVGLWGTAFADAPTERRVDAKSLAREILDDQRPEADRKKIIADHPGQSLLLIQAMVADLPPGDLKEEYRRIPWIWRVAVAAGKRNKPDELRDILDLATPGIIDPLRNWQAVVLGGGIINGIGLTGAWADDTLNRILNDDPLLKTRWLRTLRMAAAMADNQKVFKGTRYDALRIVGMDSWDHRGAQLFRYLIPGVDEELQQGAIGGLGDLRSPYSAQALLSGYSHYNAENRGFVIRALLREAPGRAASVVDALEAGIVKPAELQPKQAAELMANPDPALRERASKLLAKSNR